MTWRASIGPADRNCETGTIDRPGKFLRDIASAVEMNIRAIVDVHRQYKAAQALHAELSRLSDADLRRRGIARQDLYRIAWELAERR
jgi:hypothetical protein